MGVCDIVIKRSGRRLGVTFYRNRQHNNNNNNNNNNKVNKKVKFEGILTNFKDIHYMIKFRINKIYLRMIRLKISPD